MMDKKASKAWIGCAVVALIVVAVLIGVCLFMGDSPKDLNAQVTINEGVEMEIENADDYAWTDVTLTLNDSYKLTTSRMAAGNVYTVGLAQFAKGDGTRFNPFIQKCVSVYISCDQGSYYGEW